MLQSLLSSSCVQGGVKDFNWRWYWVWNIKKNKLKEFIKVMQSTRIANIESGQKNNQNVLNDSFCNHLSVNNKKWLIVLFVIPYNNDKYFG